MSEIFKQIENDIKKNKIVLYLKGTKEMPQCGFSNVVVQVLQKLNVQFKDINILENEELRQGIKDYTNWPTIPQLYINGEFVGGCDIVKEMYYNGELQKLIER